MNKKNQPPLTHIFFTPHECCVIGAGLATVIDDMQATANQPWNDEAKKIRKEMYNAASSAAAKLRKFAESIVLFRLIMKVMNTNF